MREDEDEEDFPCDKDDATFMKMTLTIMIFSHTGDYSNLFLQIWMMEMIMMMMEMLMMKMMRTFSDLPLTLALVRAKNCAWPMPTGSKITFILGEVFRKGFIAKKMHNPTGMN